MFPALQNLDKRCGNGVVISEVLSTRGMAHEGVDQRYTVHLALFALGITSALRASVPSGSIDDFMTTEMAISGAPSLAYAVVWDGVIHSDARGEMLVGSGRMVT